MFFAPEGLEDSALGFNPGKHPRKAVRPERARDHVGQMPPIATEKEKGSCSSRRSDTRYGKDVSCPIALPSSWTRST